MKTFIENENTFHFIVEYESIVFLKFHKTLNFYVTFCHKNKKEHGSKHESVFVRWPPVNCGQGTARLKYLPAYVPRPNS
jgi:hypothetical protein